MIRRWSNVKILRHIRSDLAYKTVLLAGPSNGGSDRGRTDLKKSKPSKDMYPYLKAALALQKIFRGLNRGNYHSSARRKTFHFFGLISFYFILFHFISFFILLVWIPDPFIYCSALLFIILLLNSAYISGLDVICVIPIYIYVSKSASLFFLSLSLCLHLCHFII